MPERTGICGLWGTAKMGPEPFMAYCNASKGHDGGHAYENSRGNVFPLDNVDGGAK